MNEKGKKKKKKPGPLYTKAFRQRVLYQLTLNGGNVGRTEREIEVGCERIKRWRDEPEGQAYIAEVEKELMANLKAVEIKKNEVALITLNKLNELLEHPKLGNVWFMKHKINEITKGVIELTMDTKGSIGNSTIEDKIAQALSPAAWKEKDGGSNSDRQN